MPLSRRHFLSAAAAGAAAAGFPLAAMAQSARALTMQAAWINDAEFLGYFVALEKGFYQAQGLDLKYLSGGPDVIPEASLLSGRADVALATVETAIRAITAQGAPLVIIGAQYQKSPAGIVSLASNPIRTPADMVGKTIAVPPVNRLAIDALLKLNGIERRQVRIVPYAYDPTPLLKGEIDGSLDFVTNVPFAIQSHGQEPVSFLLADHQLPLFNDVVVVTRETLQERRDDLVRFLRASRQGWDENFRDVDGWPPRFAQTWFKGTGRSIANEVYFNNAQKPLIAHEQGVFAMTDAAIAACVQALNAVGVAADASHFDTSLLAEV